MKMTKDDYILTSLRKIKHKEWEFFVISRIIHGLDDDEIEFVSQQLVRRPNNTWALMDLYFPQFGLHIEIDEPNHLNQQEADAKRERDIVQITGREPVHIAIAEADKSRKSIATIRAEVDKIIDYIKERKADLKTAGDMSLKKAETNVEHELQEIGKVSAKLGQLEQGSNPETLKKIQELNAELSQTINDFETRKQEAVNSENQRQRDRGDANGQPSPADRPGLER